MIQIDEHIFQMGWFNHQPANGLHLLQVLLLKLGEVKAQEIRDMTFLELELWNIAS